MPAKSQARQRAAGAAQWTIDTLHARLERLARDPWDGNRDVRQCVTAQMRSRLGPS
ncbi:hypothetical protein [Burkholderia ubonensis]|uniref:hypothetical protein n=1 Tax=Burkholderia ubonensis TaxID=101571 RepID=UPI000B1665B6|nr:hypothetical protein [Burkholderia ubonensis]